MRGLSLVAVSGGHSSSRCAGLSLSRPLLLRSTGSRHAGSVVVAQGPSCSAACGIFPDQGSNPALAGRFSTTAPPGKPYFIFIIYFWLHWVFVAACGLSLVAVSGDYSSLQCVDFSLRWLLLLWCTGSRCTGFSSCSTRAQ